jgi:excisionase family DNA binding protein
MKNVTFENLPETVERLYMRVDELVKLLSNREQNPSEKLRTIDEAAAFLNLSKATLYGYVHRKQIPFLKKSKRLYFVESELLNWIKDSRKENTESVVLKIGKGKKGGNAE